MNNSSIFQKGLPHLVAVIGFLIISCIYFSPQLQGKKVKAGDTISHRGMSKEIKDFQEETGERTLWTNAMFGGMPTYQIGAYQPTNTLKYIEKTSNLFIARPIGYFFTMMLSFYVLMLLLGVNSWLSMIGAIAFSLTTNNLILFGAGHMTKIRTLGYFAFIFGGMILAFRKKHLTGAILFAVGLGINLYANHIQMTYYLFLSLIAYAIIELVRHSRAGELPAFGKAILYLGIAGVIAIGSSASSLWTTYEYSKDTMRGDPILKKEVQVAESSSTTSGLDPSYAMQYSNGWLDLFASFIPRVVGGGGSERVGTDSATSQFIRKNSGQTPRDLRLPLYWGPVGKQMSTAGPIYFGAAMFFLFILGMLVVKGPLKWGVGAGVILTMLLSLGDSFWGFNQLFFDYFPLYNKFRTPNSVLTITSFLVPVLGTLAVSEIMKGKTSKQELLKSLYIATGVMAGICLFFALMGSSFLDFSNSIKDPSYESNYNLNLEALRADRASVMVADSWRSLLIILGTAGLLWAFLTDKIKSNILLAGLAVITIGDLWDVGKKYLGADDFVNQNNYESYKTPRKVDRELFKDTDPNFRVHDFTINPWNSSSTSYHHKTIGGYHPAKLQRYQDIIERYISSEDRALRNAFSQQGGYNAAMGVLANSTALNMLNAKYLIINPDGAPVPNPSAMGNAWFVDGVKMVASANDEINQLRTENVKTTAVIHDEYKDYIGGATFQKNGTISLTSYAPNHLTYQSNTTSDQLAVFSEVWYGPNKGWQAYIDGSPVDHIRANYVLRAMKVPAGQHTIEFKFDPKAYSIGKMITLICSLAILGAFLWLIWKSLAPALQDNGTSTNAQKTSVATQPKKKPLKKTTSKKKKKK